MAERGWWGGLLDETAKLPEGITQLVRDAVTRQPRTDPTQPVVTPGPGSLLDLTPVPALTDAYKASDDVGKGGYEGGKAVGTYLGGLLGIIPAVGAVRKAGPIRAYHGSPHSFDKFELRPGTGEGSAAYGHGLYVAENEAVAKRYRDIFNREPAIAASDPRVFAAAQLDYFGGDREKALAELVAAYKAASPRGVPDKVVEDAIQLLRSGSPIGDLPKTAHMYEVNVHADPAKMLDWDRRLSEQPEVQKLIRDLGLEREYTISASSSGGGPFMVRNAKTGGTINVASTREEAERLARAWADPQGANVYQSSKLVPGDYSDPAAASAALKEAGIPGIKYLDQGSRGWTVHNTYKGEPYGDPLKFPTQQQAAAYAAEQEAKGFGARVAQEGTSNYVVFDPSLIEIMRKYGIPIGAGGAAAATVPGLLNEGQTY